MTRADPIDALLPQTQCTRCGYPGCRPYAEALATAGAPINRCPPGGEATIRALAALLSRPELPLDPACGAEAAPQVAVIDEARCIGCARCLPPCPVDAIVGASRYMHTILAADCTGCELCIAPCPVDCISLVPRASIENCPAAPSAAENRRRYEARLARDLRRAQERAELLAQRKLAVRAEPLR
jgi:electron transport complex protein RnfB